MFPEYRDLITQLKTSDDHFRRLFDKHNELDQRILNIEARIASGSDDDVHRLKREKLQVKDQLYVLLKKAAVA